MVIIHKKTAPQSPLRKHISPSSSPVKKSRQFALRKALGWTAKTDANQMKYAELGKFLRMLAERHLDIKRRAADSRQCNGREEIQKALIDGYPHVFRGHNNKLRVRAALDYAGQYHAERRFKQKSSCRTPEVEEGDQDQNSDVVFDDSISQSAEERRQSHGSRNSSPVVSISSKDCSLVLCEEDTLTKFLESCDPPMLCWREPLVAFGCEDLETLRLLVNCDKKHVILQQILDQACLKKALTKVHVLFLLWNLGFPPA